MQTLSFLTPASPRLRFAAFKHVKAMSRGTTCYTCDIALDGVVIASAENRGDGGSTHVRMHPGPIGQRKTFEAALLAAVSEWLAPMLALPGNPLLLRDGTTGEPRLETMVDTWVEQRLVLTALVRIVTGRQKKGAFSLLVESGGGVDVMGVGPTDFTEAEVLQKSKGHPSLRGAAFLVLAAPYTENAKATRLPIPR